MPRCIAECYANFECRLADSSLINEYSLFVWEVVKTATQRHPSLSAHYSLSGDGIFMLSDGNTSRYRRLFKSQNL